MVTEKKGYRLSVFRLGENEPDILTFYHMSEKEMIDWVEEALCDPFNNITHIVQEEFKINGYE